jgi:hypothetical protein
MATSTGTLRRAKFEGPGLLVRYGVRNLRAQVYWYVTACEIWGPRSTGTLRRAKFEGQCLLVRYVVRNLKGRVYWYVTSCEIWRAMSTGTLRRVHCKCFLIVVLSPSGSNLEQWQQFSSRYDVTFQKLLTHSIDTVRRWNLADNIRLNYEDEGSMFPETWCPCLITRLHFARASVVLTVGCRVKIVGQSACSTAYSMCRGSRDVLSEALSCDLCGATEKCDGNHRIGGLSHKYGISTPERNAGLMLASFTGQRRGWCCVELYIVLRTQALVMLCGTIHNSANTSTGGAVWS